MANKNLEKLQRELQRIVDRKGDYIEDTVERVADEYYSVARDLLKEVTDALQDVDSDDVGKVAAVRTKILRETERAAELIWKAYSERLDKVIDYIDDYFARTGHRPRIDRDVVEALKGAWPDPGTPGSGIAGDIYSLSLHHGQALANAMTRNVLGGLPRRQMVKELQEKTQRTRAQAAQLTRDSTMAFSRSIEAKKAEAAGMEFFEYMGPEDRITRPFCDKIVGKVFTRAEIEKMDNGQTGAGSVMIHGGGYNCRHSWNPVERDWFSDEEWAKIRGEPEAYEWSRKPPQEVDEVLSAENADKMLDESKKFWENKFNGMTPEKRLVEMKAIRADLLSNKLDLSTVVRLEIDGSVKAGDSSPATKKRVKLLKGIYEEIGNLVGEGSLGERLAQREVSGKPLNVPHISNRRLDLLEVKYAGPRAHFVENYKNARSVTEPDGSLIVKSEKVPMINFGRTSKTAEEFKATQYHEFGHYIEARNPRVFEASVRFLEKRTKGKKPKKLSELTGDPRYKSTEKALDGGFFRPYVGKEYKNSAGEYIATEVLSMGMQEFVSEDRMSAFYEKDPEHFAHIMNVFEGKYGYRKPD